MTPCAATEPCDDAMAVQVLRQTNVRAQPSDLHDFAHAPQALLARMQNSLQAAVEDYSSNSSGRKGQS